MARKLPGRPRIGFRREYFTEDGVRKAVDYIDPEECLQITSIAHRHLRGESISKIAQDFYSWNLRTANGDPWVTTRGRGRKRRLIADRVRRAWRAWRKLRPLQQWFGYTSVDLTDDELRDIAPERAKMFDAWMKERNRST